MTTKNFQTNITTEILSADGDKSLSISQLGLTLKRDILTTPIETIITPLDITDVNTGNSITMDRLTYLPIGLGALTIPTNPTNPTTCNFNDAIQLQDYNNTPSPPPTHSEVKIGSNPSTLFGININSTTATPFTIASMSDILMTSVNTTFDSATSITITGGDNLTLNATNDSIGINANNNISLDSDNLGNINLNAPNVNSNGWAMPICLNHFSEDVWSYTLGGQVFEDVFSSNPIIIPLPQIFFADNPVNGYTTTRWQINFDMNCWDMTNTNDKGFAIYLSFLDVNSNLYEPFLYNQLTPFCKWDNGATFSGANSNFKTVNFCDWISFAGLVGSFDSNIRLQMNIAGDNPMNCKYRFKLGFTRIERV